MYTRAKAVPTNPNTPRQQAVRQALGQMAVAWNALSSAERADWNIYASNVPMVDRLGETMHLSGQQHFIRSNVPRIQAGLDFVTQAPNIFNLGDIGNFGVVSVDTGTEEINLQWDGGDAWASTVGSAILVYLGRPQNAGVSYFKGPYRFCGAIPGALVPEVSPRAVDYTPSGFVLNVAQIVSVRLVLTQADGRLTNPTEFGGVSPS